VNRLSRHPLKAKKRPFNENVRNSSREERQPDVLWPAAVPIVARRAQEQLLPEIEAVGQNTDDDHGLPMEELPDRRVGAVGERPNQQAGHKADGSAVTRPRISKNMKRR